ncbi:MAG TPA: TetR/AcrR family transcriptional regulator [Dongiaceae bacterium]|nr:TetR/AcrR family transcriptional regulator [Dongiaceae bacterium]
MNRNTTESESARESDQDPRKPLTRKARTKAATDADKPAAGGKAKKSADAKPARPLKQPKQPRAQRTVERIVEATRALVIERGVDALTTNKVAERAAVNIASLYQYFPNKEALLGAVLDSYFRTITRTANDLLDALGEVSVEESTRLWARLAIAQFRANGGLMAELLSNYNLLAALPVGRELEYHLMEAMRRFLLRQRDKLAVADLDRAIYVAFHASTAVLTRHLLEPTGYYRDEEIVEELARLMAAYLYRGAT